MSRHFDPSNPDQAGDWYVNQPPEPATRSDYEKRLIRLAVVEGWNDALRGALALAVRDRGGVVGQFDTCGDLVNHLEALTR